MQLELNNKEVYILKALLNEKETDIEAESFLNGNYSVTLITHLTIIKNIKNKIEEYEETC